jgi:Cof subfamily protein (haloacid dehalogenase superfamily)
VAGSLSHGPRLVACDVDGTLLRTNRTVSDRTRAAFALAKSSGAVVLLLTARTASRLEPVAREVGHDGLAVCCNGAFVYDLGARRVVEQELIDPSAARTLVATLRTALPAVAFAVEIAPGTLVRERRCIHPWLREDEVVESIEDALADPVAKVIVREPTLSADALMRRAQEVAGPLATFTHAGADGMIQSTRPGVSKGGALARVAARLRIPASAAVAFGDMPNDSGVLSWSGHSVAVANAHPAVLAAADEVTASNDEDGVALVLERLFAGA